MVGGFATSDYLFSRLDEHFKARNMEILRPDAYLYVKAKVEWEVTKIHFRNKAVAEGAISFNIDHSVTSRVSRYTYGIECYPIFNPSNIDHISRAYSCIVKPSGVLWVPNGFSGILLKVFLFYRDLQLFDFYVSGHGGFRGERVQTAFLQRIYPARLPSTIEKGNYH